MRRNTHTLMYAVYMVKMNPQICLAFRNTSKRRLVHNDARVRNVELVAYEFGLCKKELKFVVSVALGGCDCSGSTPTTSDRLQSSLPCFLSAWSMTISPSHPSLRARGARPHPSRVQAETFGSFLFRSQPSVAMGFPIVKLILSRAFCLLSCLMTESFSSFFSFGPKREPLFLCIKPLIDFCYIGVTFSNRNQTLVPYTGTSNMQYWLLPTKSRPHS